VADVLADVHHLSIKLTASKTKRAAPKQSSQHWSAAMCGQPTQCAVSPSQMLLQQQW